MSRRRDAQASSACRFSLKLPGIAAGGGESLVEQLDRQIGERHNVGPVVLGALAGKRPQALVAVELAGMDADDLAAALEGDHRQAEGETMPGPKGRDRA